MIVVDTSVILELLLHTSIGARHADRIFDQERHAPELIDLEFVNVLRRYVRLGITAPAKADEALANFTNFSIARHAHKALLPRVWALRDSVSAYDASYVALAEMLDAPLLTCDAKLSRTHGHSAKIELLD
jgi:predicted nucleic acid-binding protein